MSRAMRNRGIELFMLPDPYQLTPLPQAAPPQTLPASTPDPEAAASSAADAYSSVAGELEGVMAADGVPGREPPACLAASHLQLVRQGTKLHRYGHPAHRQERNMALVMFHSDLECDDYFVVLVM